MRKRLREIADEPASGDVVLLREEAEVVTEREQTREQIAGLVEASVLRERAHERERARQELTLVAGEPVVGCERRVARQQAPAPKL